MSLEVVKQYEGMRAEIIEEVRAHESRTGPVLVYGSVSRAFGPYSDIDMITLGDHAQFHGKCLRGVPVQEHLFTIDDLEDYMLRSPRGWHAASDGVLIEDDSELGHQVRDIFTDQHIRISTEGRAVYVSLMLAEQAGDTQRLDVKSNNTHYARKRALGSKRANTRAYQMLIMMSDAEIYDSLPSEKMQAFCEEGSLDEATLEAIYGLHEILGDLNHGLLVPETVWLGHVAITSAWNRQVNEQGEEFIKGRLQPDFELALTDAQSSEASDQRQALAFIQRDPRSIETRAILWRLAANYEIDAEVLNGMWYVCDLTPRLLREVGCVAVQSPQFAQADISPESPLLNDADVQYSLHFRDSVTA